MLTFVRDGLDNQEIADEMWLAIDTVKTHLYRARKKLGSRNRGHSVVLAIRRGAVPLDGTPS